MSDNPAAPSNPNNGGNNPKNNRGGYRPNRRRYYHNANKAKDNNAEPEVKPGDDHTGQSGGSPAAKNPDPRGHNRGSNSGQTGRKDRTLPDRDRGPRRAPPTDQPAATQAEVGADRPQASQPESKNEIKQQPKNDLKPPEARRHGRPSRPGGQNQNRNNGANSRPAGRNGNAQAQQRTQGGPKNTTQGGRQKPGDGQPAGQGGQGPQNENGQGQQRKQRSGPQRPGTGGKNNPQNPRRRFAVLSEGGKPPGMARGEGVKKPRKPANRSGGDPESNFDYFKPPPIKTSTGIKARSQEGQYALSWWAARWIAAMENLVDGRRLGRGRSYAKDGQVLSIEEKPGGVIALVQGSRVKPYRVAIEIIALADFEWEKVFDVLASQALFAAQLLAGEMPRNIEEAFDAAGSSLFPARLGDLHTDCTCPDWANPCKHVAATHYILAERFDEDPFLLFRLRGRTSEQILAALRERRAGSSEEPLPEEPPLEEVHPAAPLTADADSFYRLGQTLDDFSLSFKEPAIEMAVLKRLGDPNFLGEESLLATLEPVYRAVRAAALEAALGEVGGEEEGNGKTEKT